MARLRPSKGWNAPEDLDTSAASPVFEQIITPTEHLFPRKRAGCQATRTQNLVADLFFLPLISSNRPFS